jgi:hypothetical protein
MAKRLENVRCDMLFEKRAELDELNAWGDSPAGAMAPWAVRQLVVKRIVELTLQIQALEDLAD